MLTEQNKKYIFFSWEPRNCKTPILYPNIPANYRQQDTNDWATSGHLTEEGMQQLAKLIKGNIDD